jgi:hypothetical protein
MDLHSIQPSNTLGDRAGIHTSIANVFPIYAEIESPVADIIWLLRTPHLLLRTPHFTFASRSI